MSNVDFEFKNPSFNREQVVRQGYGPANVGPSDDGLIVGFYRRSVLNRHRSESEGKPVHEDRDFVKIMHPGEMLNVVDREANDMDKRRWPRQWDQYEGGHEQIPDGIPLMLVFPSQPSVVDTLRGYNIHTCEQLARLSGNAISTVGMGCQEWVNKAREYLKQAEKGVDHHKFNQAMAEKNQQIDTLQRQILELTQRMEKMLANQNVMATPAQAQFNAEQAAPRPQISPRGAQPYQPPKLVNLAQELEGEPQPTITHKGGWPKGKKRGPRNTEQPE